MAYELIDVQPIVFIERGHAPVPLAEARSTGEGRQVDAESPAAG
jgi:hypothetical protein